MNRDREHHLSHHRTDASLRSAQSVAGPPADCHAPGSPIAPDRRAAHPAARGQMTHDRRPGGSGGNSRLSGHAKPSPGLLRPQCMRRPP